MSHIKAKIKILFVSLSYFFLTFACYVIQNLYLLHYIQYIYGKAPFPRERIELVSI